MSKMDRLVVLFDSIQSVVSSIPTVLYEHTYCILLPRAYLLYVSNGHFRSDPAIFGKSDPKVKSSSIIPYYQTTSTAQSCAQGVVIGGALGLEPPPPPPPPPP
uniref:Uncharacterized protein n=1 Tax=Cacopsylla melanoneura TaxID=428564 RepID=A0A8D8ZUR9_9HEMI